MARTLVFILFFVIALGIVALAHYYIWARVIRDAQLPRTWFRGLTVLVALLGLSIPATFWASRAIPPGTARGVLLVTYSWLGLLLLFVALLAAAELIRVGAAVVERLRDAPPDPQRRLVLARVMGGAVTLGVGGLGVFSLANGLGRIAVKRVEVTLARLPETMDGFSIVQLTDMHVGPTLHARFVEDVVRQVNELQPDLVAITGDLVDGSVEHLGPIVGLLRGIRSQHGTYFVTGNHEYYSGANEWTAFLKGLGIRVLENERVTIESRGGAFELAGVNDHSAARVDPHAAPNYEKAMGGRRDSGQLLVLLAHQPKAVFDAQPYGADLLLAGHTHGGQIWPWKYLVPLQQPVVAGLERFGETLVYVSSGTGYWGPPMRLGTTAEITHVILRARRAQA